MNSNLSAFFATRQNFREGLSSHISQDKLSYEEWAAVPDSHKSAALYVTFFDQITLAWNKVKSFYTEEEDGVSCMMQYLEKNVPIIKENPSRYSPKYIYRVAYNCLYCICHDIKRDRLRWEMETSNIVCYDGEELDLFDTITDTTIEKAIKTSIRDNFWELVESLDDDSMKLVDSMLDPTKQCKLDEESKSSILANLQKMFAKYLPVFCEV